MRLHQEPGFGGHLVVGQKRSFGTGVKEYCDGRFSVRMDFGLYVALTESIMVRFALRHEQSHLIYMSTTYKSGCR